MMKLCVITLILGFLSNSCLADSHHPQAFLKDIAGSKTEGEQIVQHYCGMCHAEKPMVQLGAPIGGEASAWKVRMKQGLDVLFKHADEGMNAMPARGGCFECSDKQLMLAIMAMLPKKSGAKAHK